MTLQEMEQRGWTEIDFLLITGDAYVDHPSFGAALISRMLESAGYRVGVLAQPTWRELDSFKVLGQPNLAILVTAGNLDSMVANYTAAGKPRREDDFSPGGIGGQRPDRAVVVYANRAREAYPGSLVIIGGIEASLRRQAHYDYWSDKVRRSILLDSKADLLLYGMSEFSLLEVAERLRFGQHHFADIPGVCYLHSKVAHNALILPSYEEICQDKVMFAEAFRLAQREQNPYTGRSLCQKHGDIYLCTNPPPRPLSTSQMDFVYSLPFVRQVHPCYARKGGVRSLEEVEFSITSQRGCFGGCSFCALTAHQGRQVQRRSKESILTEARLLTTLPNFKGYIHDIGGPTANFHAAACEKQQDLGACQDKECLSPEPCKLLKADHSEYLGLLREVRRLPGVKKVFVRSGVRFDYVVLDDDESFLKELCEHHTSGQLKIAPEHVSPRVLRLMGKPPRRVYEEFVARFTKFNKALAKEQYLVPYFMSSHPGSTVGDAVLLAEYLRDHNIRPQQVQDFIPTPGSLSTCMYYTGMHPLTGEKVHVPSTAAEKKMQRALLQYFLPQNHVLVRQALRSVNRGDLVGYGPKCLVPPEQTRPPKKRKR
ncbi:MAG: YgiQ family radical SAM protein [Peptococcaceae bacterium]|nr:YgiQ family radical SAM protein [Peptococcaceae bacterium]